MPILNSGLKQFQNLGKTQNSNLQDEIRKLQGSILSGRVLSVNNLGEGNDGSISVEILSNSQYTSTSNLLPNVFPLFPNIQSYPLVNEAVALIKLVEVNSNNSALSSTYYYINNINLWNNKETNALPVKDDPNFRPGVYFQEKGNINPLYSFEGDFITSGRFGNSLRLGNTYPNDFAFVNNNWSSVGEIGDPITILTNGLHQSSPSYNSITEDINQDKSSIYLTSTQQIPIEVSSKNDYLSYSVSETTESIQPTDTQTKTLNFNSGGSVITEAFKADLSALNLFVKNFFSSTDKPRIGINIIGGESLVPNPSNIPRGGLAQERIQKLKDILPNYPYLKYNQTTKVEVGKTPYNPGVDSPSDNKFTEEQFIKIEVVTQETTLTTSTTSNPPEDPSKYAGEQAIINSGRLIFNSTQDHILLSSKKSINLNTVTSVNIDAAEKTVIQTPELYLGGTNTAQPVVLGDDLVNLLNKVLTDLEYLTDALQNQLGVPVGSPIGPTNLVAQAINGKIGGYKAELSNVLSNTTKTV